jgi:hypothetical protein
MPQQYHLARWLPSGKVFLNLELIAEKWIECYWPLMDYPGQFIPQKRGEARFCKKPVKFRSEMESLFHLAKLLGGLSGFTVAHRSGALPPEIQRLSNKLKATLRDTIRTGPLYYAGGGGSNTFTYDPVTRSILMDADLWRELSLMGTRIAEATVLRWAELTSEISQGALKPGEIIDRLLQVPIPEREVHAPDGPLCNLATACCQNSPAE